MEQGGRDCTEAAADADPAGFLGLATTAERELYVLPCAVWSGQLQHVQRLQDRPETLRQSEARLM